MKKILAILLILPLSGCATHNKDEELFKKAFLNTRQENLQLELLLNAVNWDTIQAGKGLGYNAAHWADREKQNREWGARLDADIKEFERITGRKVRVGRLTENVGNHN